MTNFPITDKDGNVYWVSRSVAVVATVFKTIEDTTYVLANQRGKGAPDNNFKWNIPCGYIDFDESGEEACARELFEETGVIVNNPNSFTHVKTNTIPNDSKQNISIRYLLMPNSSFKEPEVFNPRNLQGGEKDEVNDIKWIPVDEIDKYEWAFGHEKIVVEMHEEYKKLRFVCSICEKIHESAVPYNQVTGIKSFSWIPENVVTKLINETIKQIKNESN